MGMFRRLIFGVAVISLLFLSACNNNTQNQMVTSAESKENDIIPITREYFENVNKEYTYEDIVKEIGKADGTRGSGTFYYYWGLADGSEIQLKLSTIDDKIERIAIVYPDESFEIIYSRVYQTNK